MFNICLQFEGKTIHKEHVKRFAQRPTRTQSGDPNDGVLVARMPGTSDVWNNNA